MTYTCNECNNLELLPFLCHDCKKYFCRKHYGFEKYKTSPDPDEYLIDQSEISFGLMKFKIHHTPGHAPGHVVLYNQENKFVINGDVLFNGSFGRVDLPGGDLETLKNSIFDVMFQLPEDTIVYCGHGPETTIGKEKKDNYIHQF